VTTDRISAFDVILPDPIPHKGRVLTAISKFWFDRLGTVCPHHLLSVVQDEAPAGFEASAEAFRGRSMVCRKADVVPIECVVRGYLAGSGWKEYCKQGTVCGIKLPPGLPQCAELPEAIFTPSTKAETGHDENISEADAATRIGASRVATLKALTLELYARGAAHAATRGIIIADTKFEFGLIGEGERADVLLIDEVLTPDSSRFWPADAYAPGGPQPSYDKQYVREYLERIHWDKQPPVPSLPDEVVERTRAKYIDAFTRLSGRPLA